LTNHQSHGSIFKIFKCSIKTIIFIVEKWEFLSEEFKILEDKKKNKFIYKQIPSLKKRFDDTDWPKYDSQLMDKFLEYMNNYLNIIDLGDSEFWENFCSVIKEIDSSKKQFPKKEIVACVKQMYFFVIKC
jgi:hypothetical protein